MKQIVLILGLIISLHADAQVAFKGQIHVSNAEFSLQGTLLRAKMRVSYGKNLLNRGETLNFTPILKNNLYQQLLSSVVITGKGKSTGRQRGNIPVVKRDGKEGTYYFDYDTTIPFNSWMRNASLYVESEERSAAGKGHVYEDRIFQNLTITGAETAAEVNDDYRPTTSAPVRKASSSIQVAKGNAFGPVFAQTDWIQILDPSERKTDEVTFSGLIPLADERHIGSLGTGGFNKAVLNEILQALGGQLDIPGTSISSIMLTGYGAPIGDFRHNETRSAARAYELKRYLMSGKRVVPNQVNVSWVTEDWDSITTLIDKSELRFRNAALDIIRNVDVSSGREEQLQVIGGGSLYKSLQDEVFPQVCRLYYEVTLRRENTAGVVPSSRAGTLSALYATSQHFQKGTDDYNDLMDMTARLFPTSADACINAAGVALIKGDTDKAENYLKGKEADPRAYNNIGVLYLLKGDRAKAETYLRMASKLGVPEADRALKALMP